MGEELNTMKPSNGTTVFGSFLGCALVLAAAYHAPLAVAQDTLSVEEIVVTARKRSQSLMEAPLAISAINQQQIEDRGYTDLESYFRAVPSVSLVDGGAQRKVIILRGIAVEGDTRAQSLASVYVDDTLVTGGTYGLDPRIFDMERVEVLKGPQGTLYGGGSMSGSVRYITNKANTEEFSTNFAVDFADTAKGGGSQSLDAMVNIPLVEGKLGLRVVGFTGDRSGYYRNSYFDAGNQGQVDQSGGRLSLRWDATENVSLTAGYMLDETEQNGDYDANGPDWQALSQDNRTSEQLTKDAEIATLVLDWDLGWAQLTSATARQENVSYRKQDVSTRSVVADFPDTEMRLAILDDTKDEIITEELRLVSTPGEFGKFDWIVGYFYSDLESSTDVGDYFGVGDEFVVPGAGEAFEAMHPGQEYVSTFPVGYVSPFGLAEVPGTRPDMLYREIVYANQRENSFFGELSYHFTDTLTGTVGVRESRTKTDSGFTNQFADFDPDNPAAVGTETVVTEPFTEPHTNWKYNLSWQRNSDQLFYLQAAQGFRVGTGSQPPTIQPTCQAIANERLGGPPSAVKSDTMWAYEFGTKLTFGDGRMRLNAAVFQNDWTDIQVEVFLGGSATCNIGITQNAAAATGSGVEFDFAIAATDTLQLSFAGSIVDFSLDQDVESLNAADGDRLPGHPKAQFTASADYSFGLGGDWNGFARAEVAYVGKITGQFNGTDPRPTAGNYTLTNLRLGGQKGPWDIALYANNLFDKRGRLHQQFGRAGILTLVTRPRTIGLSIRTRF